MNRWWWSFWAVFALTMGVYYVVQDVALVAALMAGCFVILVGRAAREWDRFMVAERMERMKRWPS